MRIAQIAPLAVGVPPLKYGGTERVIHTLTEELVRRGHKVTLFASGNSHTSARLISVIKHSREVYKTLDPFGLNELTLLNLSVAYQHQQEFDIIHDHVAPMSAPFANASLTPVLLTQHGPFTQNAKKLYRSLPNIHIATISNAQNENIHETNIVGTIYHGLHMNDYPFSKKHKNYLLFVGRISMEKGVHIAIKVAIELQIPIILAAKLDEVERSYFEKFIKPHLANPLVTWVGEVSEEKRNKLMSRALCLLHPVTWPEPFGLSLIEAMGYGCPVVAYKNGSIPEIILHGKTGYVVGSIVEMVNAVKKISVINRETCREYALQKFSTQKMVDGYEALYHRLIAEKYMVKTKKNGHLVPQFSSLKYFTKTQNIITSN